MNHIVKHTILLILSAICCGYLEIYAARTNARGMASPQEYRMLSYFPTKDLFKKGVYHLEETSQPDSALLCFSVIIDRYDNGDISPENRKFVSAALLNMGYLYQDTYYDYSRAYSYYLKAIDMAEKHDYRFDKPYALLGMASINQYVDIGDSPLGRPFDLVKAALHGAIENNDDNVVVICALNLCELVIDSGDYKLAQHELGLISNYRFKSDAKGIPFMNHFLAAINAFSEKDYDLMAQEFDNSIQVNASMAPMSDKFYHFATQQKVKALRLAGRHREIPPILTDLFKRANDENMQEFMLYTLKELFLHYKELGDSSLTREYEYRYLHLNDSLQRASNIARVKDAAFLNDIELSQKIVRRLKFERKIHNAIIIFVGITALIVSLSLTYYIHTQKKLRETNLSLYKRIQELLRLNPSSQMADSTPQNNNKCHNHKIENNKWNELFARVIEVMENDDRIFNPEFSIKSLSDILDKPYHDVSAAINDVSGSNFKSLLLKYRIREACRRLSDETTFRNMTMEAVAISLGFKSRTYFNAVFKQETGLTPSAYAKIAREQSEK